MLLFRMIAKFAEATSWLQIAISPILASVVAGGLIYFKMSSTLGAVLAIGVVLIGIVLGIIWAEYARKKIGTTNYMSVLLRTPELYRDEEGEKKDSRVEGADKLK